jgi:hypothetical protein
MTPWDYALRYLPVMVPTATGDIPVSIRRYHLGNPTDAKDAVVYGLQDYLYARRQKSPGFRLTFQVNGNQVSIGTVDEFLPSLVQPFWGKGSPEDCQIVLQVAMIVLGIKPERLQAWADENLGLDCNGYVGNYLWHDVLCNGWNSSAGKGAPGPNATIQDIFQWAAGGTEMDAIDDIGQITHSDKYLIARVDGSGQVVPGGPGSVPGHIAVTQPGELINGVQLTGPSSGANPSSAGLDTIAGCSLRTVESGGFPAGSNDGVGRNWMTVVRKHETLKKVFVIDRDRLHLVENVKIAPIRKGCSAR